MATALATVREGLAVARMDGERCPVSDMMSEMEDGVIGGSSQCWKDFVVPNYHKHL